MRAFTFSSSLVPLMAVAFLNRRDAEPGFLPRPQPLNPAVISPTRPGLGAGWINTDGSTVAGVRPVDDSNGAASSAGTKPHAAGTDDDTPSTGRGQSGVDQGLDMASGLGDVQPNGNDHGGPGESATVPGVTHVRLTLTRKMTQTVYRDSSSSPANYAPASTSTTLPTTSPSPSPSNNTPPTANGPANPISAAILIESTTTPTPRIPPSATPTPTRPRPSSSTNTNSTTTTSDPIDDDSRGTMIAGPPVRPTPTDATPSPSMATSTPWWASAPAVTESMGRPSGVVEAGDAAGVTASSTSGAGRVRGRVEVVVVVMASCFWFGWW